MDTFILIVLGLVFLATPYLRGLFFDQDMYLVELIIMASFLAYLIWLLYRDKKASQTFYLIVFLLPLTYLLSHTVAESPKGNLDNLMRWTSYACLFVLLVWARNTSFVEKTLPYLFHLTGTWIAFHALFGLWGWVEFKDVVLGNRMAGVLQYPNTFATLMAAFLLYALIVLTKRRLPVWSAVFFSLPLVAYGVGIFHSYSRGTLLLLPVAWFVGLVLLKGRQQILYFLYTLLAFGGAFYVFRRMTAEAAVEGAKNPGMAELFVVSVLVVALTVLVRYLSERYGDRWFGAVEAKPFLRCALPLLTVIAGFLLLADLKNQGAIYQQLPASLQERIASIDLETASSQSRFTFFEDAMEMSSDAPILGLGGEGWRVLYTSYQQGPYLSNEVHNGYLEVLLNTGWVGSLVFLLVILFLLGQIIYRIRLARAEKGNMNRSKAAEDQTFTLATLPPLAMLFAHGAIDFDFSYGTVWFVIFWLFAMGAADRTWIAWKSESPWPRRIAFTAVSVFVLVSGVYAFRFFAAEKTQVASNGGAVAFEEVQKTLERKISYNPYDYTNRVSLAKLYAQVYRQTKREPFKEEALAILKEAEALEPNNPRALFNIAKVYDALGLADQVRSYLAKALTLDRYNVELYDSLLSLQHEEMNRFLQENKVSEAKEAAIKIIELYQQYQTLFTPFKQKPIPDQRPLDLAPRSYLLAGEAYFAAGDHAKALEVLNLIGDNKDLLLQTNALRAVIHEAAGRKEEAAKIRKAMQKDAQEFGKHVETYRKLVSVQGKM
ncbi:hypothetical protein BSNK01_30610 [Bacillaceae bacterium]